MIRRALTLALTFLPVAIVVGGQQTRDAAAPVAGTASITGVVVSDDAGARAIGRAIVTISGDAIAEPRSAVTDDSGHFTISALPAGRVSVVATKRALVTAEFGASRLGWPGTPVALVEGQRATVSIRMGRGAVIAGTIRGPGGDPVPGLLVFAVRADLDLSRATELFMTTNSPTGVPVGATTDDRGEYRVYGLAPGEYVVVAVGSESIDTETSRRSTAEIDGILAKLKTRADVASVSGVTAAAASTPVTAPRPASFTVAPVYHPGTSSMVNATHFTLAAGDERTGLDFVMAPVPVTTIEGVVTSDDGQLPSNVQMSITPDAAIRFFALSTASPVLAAVPGRDGRFTFKNILPGHYVLMARANYLDGPSGLGRGGDVPIGGGTGRVATAGDHSSATFAVEEVDVSGQPISGVTLRLQRGGRFAGRLSFDAATAPAPADLTTVRLSLLPAVGNSGSSSVNGTTIIGNAFTIQASVTVAADGTFTATGLAPGRYRVQCTVPGASWWFRSAIAGGRDLLDTNLEIGVDTDVSNAVLTLTDRHSELSGHLQTAARRPAMEFTVIVFPADRLLWTKNSRRVLSTRPATDGAFTFKDLPAGDYFLCALGDVARNEWTQAAFLEQVVPAAVKVTLGMHEKKVQDLAIAR